MTRQNHPYDIEALINPDGYDNKGDSSIEIVISKVDMAVEAPLLGSINHVVLSDTLKVDLPILMMSQGAN